MPYTPPSVDISGAVVRAFKPEQAHIRGIAVLAIAFHADAVDKLHRARKIPAPAQRDFLRAQDFGADRHFGEQVFGTGCGADHLNAVEIDRSLRVGIVGSGHGGDGREQRQRQAGAAGKG